MFHPENDCLPPKHEQFIREEMNERFKNYEPTSAKGLNADMIQHLESNINEVLQGQHGSYIGTIKAWYNSDAAVQRTYKLYKKNKKREIAE